MFSTLRFILQVLSLRRPVSYSPERLARIQAKRLRKLLRTAMERSEFYRNKYRGIDLNRFDLCQLPTLTKTELMDHFDEAVTDPKVRRADLEKFIKVPENRTKLFRDRYVVCHTSGSQGQPLILLQEPWHIDMLFAIQAARGSAFTRGSILDAASRLIEPARIATVGLEPGFYPSSAAWAHYPDGARGILRVQPFAADDPKVIQKINDYQPHVLIAYATLLDNLAIRASELKLAPTLRQVVNNSENLAPRARQRLEAAFGVPVLDNYATGECMFLSQGCPAGPGAHVNADWAILEVVDEDNQPVPAGRPGQKVLITNLANTVQPIIRYEIGDQVTMSAGPCACGSRLPKIAEIQGRTADAFWVGQNGDRCQATSHIFKNAVDYLHDIREWQVIQEEPDRLRVNLLPLPGIELAPDETRDMLLHRLRKQGLPDYVKVDLAIVPELKPDAKCKKLKRMISKVEGRETVAAAH